MKPNSTAAKKQEELDSAVKVRAAMDPNPTPARVVKEGNKGERARVADWVTAGAAVRAASWAIRNAKSAAMAETSAGSSSALGETSVRSTETAISRPKKGEMQMQEAVKVRVLLQ